MFVHLAPDPLVSEAFCLATQRTLAPSHPLHVLLAPHFEGTLFINEGAARILLPSAGFIDVMFAAPIQTPRPPPAAIGWVSTSTAACCRRA